MKIKCSNCGYECKNSDIFCSHCGFRLDNKNKYSKTAYKNLNLDTLSQVFKNNDSKKDLEFLNSQAPTKNIYDTMIFNFVISLIIICSIITAATYFWLDKQSQARIALQYKNYMKNPAQIPEFKEPSNYKELISNLSKVNKFLLMYLKYSDDTQEKKEQIFISYLREISKITHITSEGMFKEGEDICSNINSLAQSRACASRINRDLKRVGIKAYPVFGAIALHPDNVYIRNNFAKYLSPSMQEYLDLRAKYNTPVNVLKAKYDTLEGDIAYDIYMSPRKLADKIYDFEKLHSRTQNQYVKEQTEKILYYDFRRFIFTPSIYATTTQEMKNKFKNAYKYFIFAKKDSLLRPVVLSYYDKQRGYDEQNFIHDYPYKIYEESFDDNVQNNAFSDIFIQLRKNIFTKNKNFVFKYVYNMQNATWQPYEPNTKLLASQIVMSDIDNDNEVSLYSNTFSLLQQLNISKYEFFFLVNGELYLYNKDRLLISKIFYNGRKFNIHQLSPSEVSTLFPGIETIIIDSNSSSYNLYIQKDNVSATYILLTRYTQDYESYILETLKGSAKQLMLPNMFSVNTYDDVVLSFHRKDISPEATSDSSPTYKITVHTKGHQEEKIEDEIPQFSNFDEQTQKEENLQEDTHEPNIMPKIPQKEPEVEESSHIIIEDVPTPPMHSIEPPLDEVE